MTKRHFTWIRLVWWGLIGLANGSKAYEELFSARPTWWKAVIYAAFTVGALWLASNAWDELEAGARRG